MCHATTRVLTILERLHARPGFQWSGNRQAAKQESAGATGHRTPNWNVEKNLVLPPLYHIANGCSMCCNQQQGWDIGGHSVSGQLIRLNM
jgi:hypothetical protein